MENTRVRVFVFLITMTLAAHLINMAIKTRRKCVLMLINTVLLHEELACSFPA